MIMGRLIISLLLSSFLLAGPALAGDVMRIRREHFECLLRNSERYMELAKDPIIVFLTLCPNISPSGADIAALADNSLPEIAKAKDAPPNDIVVVLRKKQLACLVSRGKEIQSADWQRTHAGNADSNLVVVDRELC